MATSYGDIELGDEDEIIVSDGKTLFDGVVNPEDEGEDGLHTGELTINGPGVDEDGIDRAGGTLVLLQNEEEGPSEVHVREFNLDEGGTLMVELDDRRTTMCRASRPIPPISTAGIFALYNPGFYDDDNALRGRRRRRRPV